MNCYLIAAIDIEDKETYKLYEEAGVEVLSGWQNVELLAMDDNPFVLEGKAPGKRIVLVRFESEAKLKEWYYGDGYQSAAKIRQRSSHTAFLVGVHGFEG